MNTNPKDARERQMIVNTAATVCFCFLQAWKHFGGANPRAQTAMTIKRLWDLLPAIAGGDMSVAEEVINRVTEGLPQGQGTAIEVGGSAIEVGGSVPGVGAPSLLLPPGTDMLSRLQIKATALDFAGEDLGAGGLDRPAAMDTWVNTATDELARLTDAYSACIAMDTVAGQPTYTAPGPSFYKMRTATWSDGTGDTRQLQVSTPPELDEITPYWRNESAGTPRYLLSEGLNRIRLCPPPLLSTFVYAYSDLAVQSDATQVTSAARPFVTTDVNSVLRVPSGQAGFTAGVYQVQSVTGGIATLNTILGTPSATGGTATLSLGGVTAEGFAAPSTSWPNPTDLCPLPEQGHMAVVWRVVIFRASQFRNADSAAALALARAEYKTARELFEAEAIRLNAATESADINLFPFAAAFW